MSIKNLNGCFRPVLEPVAGEKQTALMISSVSLIYAFHEAPFDREPFMVG